MNIEVKNSVKLVNYNDSMKYLDERVENVLAGSKNELLWILEHNTVYTAGTSSNDQDIINKNLSITKTNRGGKHTLHSPGQKVVYFVLNLNKREKDIKKLVNKLEVCIIEILKEYNVESFSDKKNIGIWIKKENKLMKIAAIGIRVKRWVAYHGFSINLFNDLSLYKNIVPCGIKDKGITSLKELGIKDFNKIDEIISEKFLNTFL